jgi:hypothetical protein
MCGMPHKCGHWFPLLPHFIGCGQCFGEVLAKRLMTVNVSFVPLLALANYPLPKIT